LRRHGLQRLPLKASMEDINRLYNQIVARAKANGVVSQEAWDGIVDEVVEEFRTMGNTHDDEETEGMEEDLRSRFPEYEELINERGF
jgi:hypothetical protein